MSEPKQIRLAINLLASGRHNASWKTLADPAGLSTDIDVFIRIAQTAERGLLDGIFLADNYAGLAGESFKRPFRALSPGVLLAALATHTGNIGLVLTAPALYGDPVTLAREIASLDHVSKGRGAWNIITSQHEHSLKILGAGGELARSAKYDKADEYVTVVTQLWDSLPSDAIVADAASSTYVDAGRLRPVEFQGDYYRASGVLGVVGGYQGRRPVLLQAGASESSKQFGSKWADAVHQPLDEDVGAGVLRRRQAVRGAEVAARSAATATADAAAALLERSWDSPRDFDRSLAATLAASKAKITVEALVLDVIDALAQVASGSTLSTERALDRHWRNVKVLASHNPSIYKQQILGGYEVHGTKPPLDVYF